VRDLGNQLRRAQNRAGDQMWEVSDEQREIDEVVFGGDFPGGSTRYNA
jgi:hypothetical protein